MVYYLHVVATRRTVKKEQPLPGRQNRSLAAKVQKVNANAGNANRNRGIRLPRGRRLVLRILGSMPPARRPGSVATILPVTAAPPPLLLVLLLHAEAGRRGDVTIRSKGNRGGHTPVSAPPVSTACNQKSHQITPQHTNKTHLGRKGKRLRGRAPRTT